ncbi:unknown protein [Seminavis robusta]|uniref:DUF5898 domain-containing protein n=1 Tax=Seminavis robusta TaxID=568900 RepID=A0A9N8E7W8_9STRA|nr:unknown protein [Seminavis robusta]|eukprot:Sro749_g196850.1 n/a (494) ;mRNA; r:41550-43031
MKAAGDDQPMGAVMTYNKIVLVTLDNLKDDDERIKWTQKAKDELNTDREPARKVKQEDETPCAERDDSPVKPVKRFSDVKTKDEVVKQVHDREREVPGVVYYTRVHKGGDVFPCLLQGLHIAYHKALGDNRAPTCVKVEDGDELGGRFVFKVSKGSFAWVLTPTFEKNTKEPFCAKFDGRIPSAKTEYFYLLGRLGEDRNATVYLACSLGGHVCAVKDYYVMLSHAANEKDREAQEANERYSKYQDAEEEGRRWQELYGGIKTSIFRSSSISRPLYLGTSPCLLMPYGYEIHNAADRWQWVPDVGKELMRFAANGYQYMESDLRWRHVLLNYEKKLFLCDLLSLAECDEAMKTDATKQKKAVYEQLLILLKPMVDELGDEEIVDTLEWIRCSRTLGAVVSCIEGVETLLDYFHGFACKGSDLLGYLQALFPQGLAAEDLSEEAKVCLFMIANFESSKSEASSPEPSLGEDDGTRRRRADDDIDNQAAKREKKT